MSIHLFWQGVMGDWLATASERHELLAMDDQMRRDIGLTKVDVEYLVDRPSLKAPGTPPQTLVRPSDVGPAATRTYIDRAHQLRAQAIGDSVHALWRWLRVGLRSAQRGGIDSTPSRDGDRADHAMRPTHAEAREFVQVSPENTW